MRRQVTRTAGPHGRRESVRRRWARGEYDQLQPTAPGLVFPLVQLAMAQAASCGVRETQLQVRDRLTVHCTVNSVFSRSPERRKAEPPDIASLAWRSRLSVPARLLQGVSSVGTGSAGAVLGQLHVHEEVNAGQDDT